MDQVFKRGFAGGDEKRNDPSGEWWLTSNHVNTDIIDVRSIGMPCIPMGIPLGHIVGHHHLSQSFGGTFGQPLGHNMGPALGLYSAQAPTQSQSTTWSQVPNETRTQTPTSTQTPISSQVHTRTQTTTYIDSSTDTPIYRHTSTQTPTFISPSIQTTPNIRSNTQTTTRIPTSTQTPPHIHTSTQTPPHIHTSTQSPYPIHTSTQTPPHIHTSTQSPYPLHTITQTPPHIHTSTQSPYPIHTSTQTPSHIHTSTQSPYPIHTSTQTPPHINTSTQTPPHIHTSTQTSTQTLNPTRSQVPQPPTIIRLNDLGYMIIRKNETPDIISDGILMRFESQLKFNRLYQIKNPNTEISNTSLSNINNTKSDPELKKINSNKRRILHDKLYDQSINRVLKKIEWQIYQIKPISCKNKIDIVSMAIDHIKLIRELIIHKCQKLNINPDEMFNKYKKIYLSRMYRDELILNQENRDIVRNFDDNSELPSQINTQNSLNDSGIANITADNSFVLDSQILSQPMTITNSNNIYSQNWGMDECFDMYGNWINQTDKSDDINFDIY